MQARSRGLVILSFSQTRHSHSGSVPITVQLPPLPLETVNAFFSFIGDGPSPFTNAYERKLIETHLAVSEPIRAVVNAIAKATQGLPYDDSASSAWRLNEISSQRPGLERHLKSLLPKTGEIMSQTALIFAALLSLYEVCTVTSPQHNIHKSALVTNVLKLMIDITGAGFVSVIGCTSQVLRNYPASIISSLFPNKCLALVYEMFELVKCLILDEDTFLADAILPVHITGEHESEQHSTAEEDFHLFRLYCLFLTALTRANARYVTKVYIPIDVGDLSNTINCRAVRWETQARSLISKLPQSTGKEPWMATLTANGLIESGLRVIVAGREANDIHQRIGAVQVQPSSSSIPCFTSLQPVLYTYGLVRLARLFKDPLWHLVDEQPPAVEHIPRLEALVSSGLESLHNRLPYVGCELIFYLHFLPRMALEVNSIEDRGRIVFIMRSILAKGFVVTAPYISDVEITWQFGDRLRLCRKGLSIAEA